MGASSIPLHQGQEKIFRREDLYVVPTPGEDTDSVVHSPSESGQAEGETTAQISRFPDVQVALPGPRNEDTLGQRSSNPGSLEAAAERVRLDRRARLLRTSGQTVKTAIDKS